MSDTERTTLHAQISGRVQGVGFRASALRKGNRLGLGGWVRNERDGSVTVVAEGPRDKVKEFEQWLHTGPRSAHVVSVDTRYSEYQGQYDGFRVEY